MPSRELVARVAFALRNDLNVKAIVPVSNARLVNAVSGCGTATLRTICVLIVPSFVKNFSGRAVLIKPAMDGSNVASGAPPAGPGPGLPPEGMITMSSSGHGYSLFFRPV